MRRNKKSCFISEFCRNNNFRTLEFYKMLSRHPELARKMKANSKAFSCSAGRDKCGFFIYKQDKRIGRNYKADEIAELLICGECGEHYRRVTWTAKGFKEIKWRCVSRIQYGKKKCHSSPTVYEQALHRAIVSAINEFCEVKDDVAKALRESITEVLDPNQNGSIQAAQQRIDELARNMDELIMLATVPETAENAMSDIAKFSEEMKMLREFIETEKAKQTEVQHGSNELSNVLQSLEKEDFALTEYEDIVTRQLIEQITVDTKNTITVRFKGGFEMRANLN